MKVRFKKLSPGAVLPTKAHPTDAGFDLTATSVEIDDFDNVVYHTDIAFEIPEGYVGLLFPRSSNAKKDLVLSNSVGVIDCHYRGEVTMKFKPTSATIRRLKRNVLIEERYSCRRYEVCDRVGQLIIMPYPEIEFEEADELSETDRGNGGYGSTGK